MNTLLEKNRDGIAINMANAVVKEMKPRKGEPNFFEGEEIGCEVPMDLCQEACGIRNICRLRLLRNGIHNALVQYENCVKSAKKEGGAQ